MTRTAPAALKIDVLVVSDRWKDKTAAKAVVRRAVTRAAATRSTNAAEIAIVLADDSAIRLLNRDWRGVDAATNVLSFPTKNPGGQKLGGHELGGHLGDIILAFETIAREARDENKPFAHHLTHLAVHGYLHLVGYDHERDDDAEIMERTEREILHELAIPDPYRESGEPARQKTGTAAKAGTKARIKEPARVAARRPRQRAAKVGRRSQKS